MHKGADDHNPSEQEQPQSASPRASGTPKPPVEFPVAVTPSPFAFAEPLTPSDGPFTYSIRTRSVSGMASTSARIRAALNHTRGHPALTVNTSTRKPSAKRKKARASAPNSTPTAGPPTPHNPPSSSLSHDPMTLSGQNELLSSAPTPLDISRWMEGQPSQWVGVGANGTGDVERYNEDSFSPRY